MWLKVNTWNQQYLILIFMYSKKHLWKGFYSPVSALLFMVLKFSFKRWLSYKCRLNHCGEGMWGKLDIDLKAWLFDIDLKAWLFNRKTSVSSGRPQHLEHYHTEHRGPTGLCAQPAALHAADPRLHCQVQLQPHHQVRRWHISGRSHQQQRLKRTTERKWHSWLNGVALTTCPSMWRRQRRLWWTSGETLLTTPTDHRHLDCGESQQH